MDQSNKLNPEILQKEYYKKTAKNYDHMHGVNSYDDEHTFALFQLIGLLEYLNINSILDVGSGTGRAIKFINARFCKKDAGQRCSHRIIAFRRC